MRSFLLLVLSICSIISVQAQSDSLNTTRNFYHLYDGKMVFGDSLYYNQPVIGDATINIDGQYDYVDSIMFFQDEVGFFVNTKYSNSRYLSEFAVRTIKGKYNYYIQVPIKKYQIAKSTKADISAFTEKGRAFIGLEYNDPVPANASNMYKALHTNPMVEKDVTKLRRHSRWGTSLILLGVSTVTAGFVYNASQSRDVKDSALQEHFPAIVGGVVGSACIVSGSIIIAKSPNREDIIRKANSLTNN